MGRRDSWWFRETGGMVNWLAVTAVAITVAMIGVAVVFSTQRSAPTAAQTPRPQSTMTLPAAPEHALFIGDSYSAGVGASTPKKGWASIVSRDRGWSMTNASVGGSGYIADLGTGQSYGEVLDALADIEPDVVVVSGGRNDHWFAQGDVEDAAERLFADLQVRFPSARILVVNPWWDDDSPSEGFAGVVTAVSDAAADTGVAHLSAGQPLEHRPEYLSDDGVHPNDEGHAALADSVLDAMDTPVE